MQISVLVNKSLYSPCNTVGGPLVSTDSSLSGKLLSSLVSAVVVWLCLSFMSLAAFCQSVAFIVFSLFELLQLEVNVIMLDQSK